MKLDVAKAGDQFQEFAQSDPTTWRRYIDNLMPPLGRLLARLEGQDRVKAAGVLLALGELMQPCRGPECRRLFLTYRPAHIYCSARCRNRAFAATHRTGGREAAMPCGSKRKRNRKKGK